MAVAVAYLGYGLIYWGWMWGINGAAITLGDAVLPWRYDQLQAAISQMCKNGRPHCQSGGPAPPTPLCGQLTAAE